MQDFTVSEVLHELIVLDGKVGYGHTAHLDILDHCSKICRLFIPIEVDDYIAVCERAGERRTSLVARRTEEEICRWQY